MLNVFLLHDPDSIRTGINGRAAVVGLGCSGMFIGVERADREAPISTDSMSM